MVQNYIILLLQIKKIDMDVDIDIYRFANVGVIYLCSKDPAKDAHSIDLSGNGPGIQVWKTTLTFVFIILQC